MVEITVSHPPPHTHLSVHYSVGWVGARAHRSNMASEDDGGVGGGSKPLHFRVCVSGCSSAGKSTLIQRLITGKYVHNVRTTIGVEYPEMTEVSEDGLTVSHSFVDLAGQERFRAVCAIPYRSACAVLVVFDITGPTTDYASSTSRIPSDVPYWIGVAHENAGDYVPVILVANKVDTARGNDDDAAVNLACILQNIDESVQAMAYGGHVYATSSVTGHGVDDLFDDIRHIERMTEKYQVALIDAASAPVYTRGDAMTGDAPPTRRPHCIRQNEPLVCVVAGANGKSRVVRKAGIVNPQDRRGRTAPVGVASSSSPSGAHAAHPQKHASFRVQSGAKPRGGGSTECPC